MESESAFLRRIADMIESVSDKNTLLQLAREAEHREQKQSTQS